MIDLAQAKRHLNETGTTNDAELQDFIDAVIEWIEKLIGPVVPRTITTVVRPGTDGRLYLGGPTVSVSSVTSAYGWPGSYDVATMYVDTAEGIVEYGGSGKTFAYPVTVTRIAGYTQVPAPIRTAALILLKALWETQRGASGLSIQGIDEVVEQPGMGVAVWRARMLLRPYMQQYAL